ncbi:MAG TPA: hypothetical protein VM597_03190 [Gemmataceae bacterium]|nr:hypothetical protein [Gemmataceae bacterium]
MSWNTTGLLIKADHSADYPGLLRKLDLAATETGETVSFDEAASSSNEGVAVATVDGWTALWGSIGLLMVDDDGVAELARSADVLQLVLAGASDTAGFTWWKDGKVARDWMRQGGRMVKEQGKPLPQETAAFAGADDEQAILRLLESLTLPYERLESVEYEMFELSFDDLTADY